MRYSHGLITGLAIAGIALGAPAAASAAPAVPAGNSNVNIAPWQVCGSSIPLAAPGSSAHAGRCRNADMGGRSDGGSNVNVLPVQVCGWSAPVVGGPASAESCRQGTAPDGDHDVNVLPVQVCGNTVAVYEVRAPIGPPSGPTDCRNAPLPR